MISGSVNNSNKIDFISYYRSILVRNFKINSQVNFYVRLLKNNRNDICSNFAILISLLKNDAKLQFSNIVNKLERIESFQDIHINSKGVVFWNIPEELWYIKFQNVVELAFSNSNECKYGMFSVDSNMFRPIYMYTRIISVIRYFYDMFPSERLCNLDIKKVKLEIISRHRMINLIKVLTEWVECQFTNQGEIIYSFLIRLEKEFDKLWLNSLKGTCMCFIVIDDLKATKILIACLDVIRIILEKAFQMIGVKPIKELE